MKSKTRKKIIKHPIQMKRRISALLTCFLFLKAVSGQITSPFNGGRIADTSASYSIVVSGHFHGASTNISTFPAATLQAGIDTLNSIAPVFVMHLGDLFLQLNDLSLANYRKALFSRLKPPLLNAVGNHDISGGQYETRFGKTFFTFRIASEKYIVLNTEMDDGSIKGEQKKMLAEELAPSANNGIKSVFIFSHRPVWTEGDKKYRDLFSGHTHSVLPTNFKKDILPLFTDKGDRRIYWISGSLGGMTNTSFFYDQNEAMGITCMQTAIRDEPRDALLKIELNSGKAVFTGVSLTGQKLLPVEQYDLVYWQKQIGTKQDLNYRLLPYLVLQMLSHHYFWIGFVSAFILILLIRSLRQRWKKER